MFFSNKVGAIWTILVLSLVALSAESAFLCKDPSQFLKFVAGYQAKIHQVKTADGYHLTMFQIFPTFTAKPKASLFKLKQDYPPKGN